MQVTHDNPDVLDVRFRCINNVKLLHVKWRNCKIQNVTNQVCSCLASENDFGAETMIF